MGKEMHIKKHIEKEKTRKRKFIERGEMNVKFMEIVKRVDCG